VSLRIQKVNELLKRELGKILLKELDISKNILLTITHVETTGNLIESNIFVSTIPEKQEKETLKFLNKEIYNIQQLLNKRLYMRPVPKIKFCLDEQLRQASEIERILEKESKKIVE